MTAALLDQVCVASPCPESWEGMAGDERVRSCARCQLQVFNLSELNRDEAEALIRQKEGRLCVRYYQRSDGTVMTADCPEGIRKRRMELIICGVVLCVLLGLPILTHLLAWLNEATTTFTTVGTMGIVTFDPPCKTK